MVIDEANDAHAGENAECDNVEHENALRVNFILYVISRLVGVMLCIHTIGGGDRSSMRSTSGMCRYV